MSRKKKYILVCTDDVTKWVEAKALAPANEQAILNFIYEEIFTKLGVPREITTDHEMKFTSKLIKVIMEQYQIRHWTSTPYTTYENLTFRGGHLTIASKSLILMTFGGSCPKLLPKVTLS